MKAKTLLLIVLAAVALPAAPVRAQEILLEGPLAGAPAVRRLVLFREERFFLTPTITFTLIDTYRRHVLFGAKAEYNIFDWLSAGVHFAGGFGWTTGVSDQIDDKGVDDVPNSPYDYNFPQRGHIDDQLGKLTWMGDIEARIIPFRGKFSLFGELVLAMDLYINLGVGIVGIEERTGVDCSGGVQPGVGTCPLADTSPTMESRIAVGPTFGGGVTIFFNDYVGLNIEYRSTPFEWNQSGTDEYGDSDVELDQRIDDNDGYLYWNNMFTIGVTFAFPFEAKRTE